MAKRKNYIFTSESVGEGHPDKVCDQISDAVLDDALRQDRESRVACECYATTGLVLVGGEISTSGYIDVRGIAKKVLQDIGYNRPEYGIDHDSCAIVSSINQQSPDIAMGVNEGPEHLQGAGDQGLMFGYACNETENFMPAALEYSHKIMKQASDIRKEGVISYLRPDAKCQVTVEYRNGKLLRIPTVVLSHQHDPEFRGTELSQERIARDLIQKVIKPVIPARLLKDTKFLINPTGRFVIGGPAGDTGLTGRKIIVDTYGGKARHGGGAFSGKDPSKVDRSAAYMARYLAKNIVASGVATECEVQLAYAIGVAEPVSLYVNSFGTSRYSDDLLEIVIRDLFDLRPRGIIDYLDLKRPIYQKTASYGHFGRPDFPWEQVNRTEDILKKLGE